MKISTNKSGPGDKEVSKRRYANEGEKKKQESSEGKNTPFQNALRDAESRNLKQFHYSDKTKKASDKPFEGSRPIATRSTAPVMKEHTPVPEKKVVIPNVKPEVSGMPRAKVTGEKTTITPKYEQEHKGTRAHGTVKNTIFRKIDAAIHPDKYGAPSNQGKNININRSTQHSSGQAKPSGYDIALGGDKSKTLSVKKLKPKQIMKAAKEKGYIK